jgi:hypothetical protein
VSDGWPRENCARCGGTGTIYWAGVYVPRSSMPVHGPCIRCRPADFCERIGLKPQAAVLRHRGYA